MGIFDRIKSAIFGSAKATEAAPSKPSGAATTTAGAATAAAAAGTSTARAGATAAAPMSQVDVEVVLTDLAAKNKQKLDWRKSIVDLMKLLDLDSSLAARKELAKELNYTGDTSDSASMNIWLHKQMMAKLAANGGKLPPDIKH